MFSDMCQKQSFQVFLSVSRALWVVLGSEMDQLGWSHSLPWLVQILAQLWDPAVPKCHIVIFINVPCTQV